VTRIAFAIVAVGLAAADWPGWRGPTGDGVAPADADPPLTWSATDNVKWRVPLPGAGNGSPVVAGDRVYLTATSGRDHGRLHVLAFDLQTGKQIWRADLFGTPAPAPFSMFPPERGHAAPTPAAAGGRLFCLFGTGDLLGLDADGRPVWMRSLAKEYGPIRNDYGIAASPVVHGGTVLVQVDHLDGSYLLAADAATGRTLWKTPRPHAYDNWATPVVADVAGTKQVVCLGTGRVTGYDLATGKEAWSVEGVERLCSATPVVRGDALFVTSGPAGANLRLDLGTAPPRVVWRTKKTGPFIPSAVEAGGLYFQPDDQGWVTCYDAGTGAEVWRERAFPGRGRPAPVAAAGRVYFTALDGTTVVVRAGREFEVLARNKLGEDAAASPAAAGGALLFRTDKHLVCVGR
jgi:outer membrane protein assembly factor BamB